MPADVKREVDGPISRRGVLPKSKFRWFGVRQLLPGLYQSGKLFSQESR